MGKYIITAPGVGWSGRDKNFSFANPDDELRLLWLANSIPFVDYNQAYRGGYEIKFKLSHIPTYDVELFDVGAKGLVYQSGYNRFLFSSNVSTLVLFENVSVDETYTIRVSPLMLNSSKDGYTCDYYVNGVKIHTNNVSMSDMNNYGMYEVSKYITDYAFFGHYSQSLLAEAEIYYLKFLGVDVLNEAVVEGAILTPISDSVNAGSLRISNDALLSNNYLFTGAGISGSVIYQDDTPPVVSPIRKADMFYGTEKGPQRGYFDFDGSSWFETDYIPTEESTVLVKCSMSRKFSNNYIYSVFSARAYPGIIRYGICVRNGDYISLNDTKSLLFTEIVHCDIGQDYEIKIDWPIRFITYDSQTQGSGSVSIIKHEGLGSFGSATQNTKFIRIGGNTNEVATSGNWYGSIKAFKIYKKGVLVRDYVALPDGTMKDLVTGHIATNGGAGIVTYHALEDPAAGKGVTKHQAFITTKATTTTQSGGQVGAAVEGNKLVVTSPPAYYTGNILTAHNQPNLNTLIQLIWFGSDAPTDKNTQIQQGGMACKFKIPQTVINPTMNSVFVMFSSQMWFNYNYRTGKLFVLAGQRDNLSDGQFDLPSDGLVEIKVSVMYTSGNNKYRDLYVNGEFLEQLLMSGSGSDITYWQGPKIMSYSDNGTEAPPAETELYYVQFYAKKEPDQLESKDECTGSMLVPATDGTTDLVDATTGLRMYLQGTGSAVVEQPEVQMVKKKVKSYIYKV
jgi:hypothetical protein